MSFTDRLDEVAKRHHGDGLYVHKAFSPPDRSGWYAVSVYAERLQRTVTVMFQQDEIARFGDERGWMERFAADFDKRLIKALATDEVPTIADWSPRTGEVPAGPHELFFAGQMVTPGVGNVDPVEVDLSQVVAVAYRPLAEDAGTVTAAALFTDCGGFLMWLVASEEFKQAWHTEKQRRAAGVVRC